MDDISDYIRALTDRAREFGAERERKFQHALEILNDLFGKGDEDGRA